MLAVDLLSYGGSVPSSKAAFHGMWACSDTNLECMWRASLYTGDTAQTAVNKSFYRISVVLTHGPTLGIVQQHRHHQRPEQSRLQLPRHYGGIPHGVAPGFVSYSGQELSWTLVMQLPLVATFHLGQRFSTGGRRELPGGPRDGRGNYSFKLPGKIKQI